MPNRVDGGLFLRVLVEGVEFRRLTGVDAADLDVMEGSLMYSTGQRVG